MKKEMKQEEKGVYQEDYRRTLLKRKEEEYFNEGSR